MFTTLSRRQVAVASRPSGTKRFFAFGVLSLGRIAPALVFGPPGSLKFIYKNRIVFSSFFLHHAAPPRPELSTDTGNSLHSKSRHLGASLNCAALMGIDES